MLNCRAHEDEIRGHAILSVGRTRTLLHSIGTSRALASSDELVYDLNAIATAANAHKVSDDVSLSGRIARMLDPGWWVRNVRGELLRLNETIEHAAGHIRRNGQCYVSNHASHIKGTRRKANRATLEALEICNEYGEAVNLQEVADASISNPKLRRSELMMRCRGFEEMAIYMDHVAKFLTLTCPSRFHRFDGKGKLNKNWDGSTPRQAQDYLRKQWAKIRAAWKRAGYSPYGFRVAEPHHDGCPHWHILIFCAPIEAGWFDARICAANPEACGTGVLGLAGRYAMQESPKEPGACKHRFTVKHIDPNTGSATGYIAKYICKNIDGLKDDGNAMGLDFASGKNAAVASLRVKDWAGTWGIRQFQQIGGPSITVWRELRRMRDELQQSVHAPFDWEALRSAADRSLFSLFWELQGGPNVPKSKLSLKPFYSVDVTGKYGDQVLRVLGVLGSEDGKEYMLRTRTHQWTIQRAGTAAVNAADLEQKEWMRINKRVREFERAGGLPVRSEVRYPLDFSLGQCEALSPWTSVNNCTNDGVPLSESAQDAIATHFPPKLVPRK